MGKIISINKIKCGGSNPFVLIAGPCVIESETSARSIAKSIKKITSKLRVPFIYKASYDKANRTSIKSFRGPGIDEGLRILERIRRDFKVPVTSDVHSVSEVARAGEVLDILQIPAFLSRQTDLVVEAGRTNKVVNVKKGQFLAPENMIQVIKKIESTGNKKILLTDRGTTFGYGNLVSDFRAVPIMQQTGYPVVFDATHSVQQPGGLGNKTGGKREFVPLMAKCAIAAGANAIFMEVHPNPDKALSDGPNTLALKNLEKLLKNLKSINKIV